MSELDKLEKYLKKHNISYNRVDEDGVFGRHSIIVPSDKRPFDWDAICQYGSYGYEDGKLEIYGNLVDYETDGDVVVGYLTAEDVIKRIENN